VLTGPVCTLSQLAQTTVLFDKHEHTYTAKNHEADNSFCACPQIYGVGCCSPSTPHARACHACVPCHRCVCTARGAPIPCAACAPDVRAREEHFGSNSSCSDVAGTGDPRGRGLPPA